MAEDQSEIRKLNGIELYAVSDEIKGWYLKQMLSYDEALEALEPIVDEMNRRGKQVAKRYGKSYSNVLPRKLLR